MTPPRATIFGAGAIGRGFLGQLNADAGGSSTFLDVDTALLEALNAAGGYPLELVDDDHIDRRQIAPIEAHLPNSIAASESIAQADWIGTCVGARHLDKVAAPLAVGLTLRCAQDPDRPINIILAENFPNAAAFLRQATLDLLSPEVRTWSASRVGFVDASIGRMVPHLTAGDRTREPLLVRAEPYAVLPLDGDAWVGPRPEVPGFCFRTPFEAVVETKRFLHNLGHAAAAYAGARTGCATLPDCMAHLGVAQHTHAVMDEAVEALARKWNLDRATLQLHAADLRQRFTNLALGDPVARVAADPLRKLAVDERLVGGVRLALAHGVAPVACAQAVANALLYDDLSDPGAVSLSGWRQSETPAGWVMRATGLHETASALPWILAAVTGDPLPTLPEPTP